MKLPENASPSKSLFLVLTILLGFIFILSFSIIYVNRLILEDKVCACIIPVPYMILILSSLGLFIGSLSSYVMVSKLGSQRREFNKGISNTLRFLPASEQKLVQAVIRRGGMIKQKDLERETGFHKVKIHRLISSLEERKIIVKEQDKKINLISLHDDIRILFSKPDKVS